MLPNLKPLADFADSIEVNADSIKNQEVDTERVSWYVERFKKAIEDCVPSAVIAYMDHSLVDERCNAITRSSVITTGSDILQEFFERSST